MSEHALGPKIREEMRLRGTTLGKLLRLVRASADLEQVARDVLTYKDRLPEEVTEPAAAAVDVLDGGDGRIYRDDPSGVGEHLAEARAVEEHQERKHAERGDDEGLEPIETSPLTEREPDL